MRASTHIFVDDSLWPLLQVKFVGEATASQVQEFLARLTGYVQRGEHFAAIVDTLQLQIAAQADRRRLYVNWMTEHLERLHQVSLGTSLVITSPLVRLALTTVFHLRPPPSPYLVTLRLSEAAEWTARRMEEAGLATPAERVRGHFGLLPSHEDKYCHGGKT